MPIRASELLNSNRKTIFDTFAEGVDAVTGHKSDQELEQDLGRVRSYRQTLRAQLDVAQSRRAALAERSQTDPAAASALAQLDEHIAGLEHLNSQAAMVEVMLDLTLKRRKQAQPGE
jgi:uncharacterized protein involved in exopolysaccharide biosynthesis